jgi:hypothetical protein
VNKDRDPPRGPQLPHWLFLPPEARGKSHAWRALRNTGESFAQIRKHLPHYTPEQVERLRALLQQPKLPADMVEFARRWREWWEEQAQAAQVHEQPPNPEPAEPESIESQSKPIESESEPIESEPELFEAQPKPIEAQPELIESEPELIESELDQLIEPSNERRVGHPRLDIPYIDEALAALRETRSDPRLKVEKKDKNFVFDFLEKRGIKLDREEKDSTIYRRITNDRRARLQLGIVTQQKEL